MSEKKIAKLIYAGGEEGPGMCCECSARAAHAIAKKLAEGVVWDKVVQIVRSPFDGSELAGWSDEDDGDYQIYFPGDHGEIEEGNEYRVTVTKEEGDG